MIDKIRFYQMYLADYLVLGTKILEILRSVKNQDLQLTIPIAKLVAALEKLKNGLRVVKANLRTEELAQLDHLRDDAWMCLYHLVLSQVRCADAEVREQAYKLEVLIRKPEMRIHKMGYQKQTACMINFFERVDSDSELSEALTKMSGEQRYSELKMAQDAFIAKENEKTSQEAEKPDRNGAEAAKNLRKAIEYLGQFLSVMSEQSGNEEYASIADVINEVVSSMNASVLAKATRLKNAREEDEINLVE